MESSILTILPNLSIGVISVCSLVYVVYIFVKFIQNQSSIHGDAMQEREMALRNVEKEVRTTVLKQLEQNSMVMADTVKSHERLMMMLDKQR
jgi:hypothetical protein